MLWDFSRCFLFLHSWLLLMSHWLLSCPIGNLELQLGLPFFNRVFFADRYVIHVLQTVFNLKIKINVIFIIILYDAIIWLQLQLILTLRKYFLGCFSHILVLVHDHENSFSSRKTNFKSDLIWVHNEIVRYFNVFLTIKYNCGLKLQPNIF